MLSIIFFILSLLDKHEPFMLLNRLLTKDNEYPSPFFDMFCFYMPLDFVLFCITMWSLGYMTIVK